MSELPSIFVSHGAPTIVFETGPGAVFLRKLSQTLGRPDAILAVTAHWETDVASVGGAAHPETIHDFYGFPENLYRLRYKAPGAPALAERARQLILDAGIDAERDDLRGLDHGTWSPLALAYPEADIPVAQISVQPAEDASHHLRLGAALAPLRKENILILGSGGAVHNLRHFRPGSAVPPQWAVDFEAWMSDLVSSGDRAAAADWQNQAPAPFLAHPRDEHFLPFLVAMGAGSGPGRTLHRGFEHGALSMAAFAFD